MLYAIICLDKPGSGEIRKANREAHLAHIRNAGQAIVEAGPFLDGAGAMCGSLVIYEGREKAEAEAWAATDPYGKAGLFERVEIRAWKKVVG
ncbi:MAG TPA: YciI family protein [Thermohalobaculum sp.]|nr:YciI family protein [Thermohalobaculum sp.]